MLCCIKTNQNESEPRNFWRKLFGGPYSRLLQKNGCQWGVIGFSTLLLGLAIVGTIFVPVGLNEQVSM